MRRVLALCTAAAAVLSLSAVRIEAAPGAEAVRAGDLAVQLARAAGVRLPAGNPEKTAAAFLAARGVVLAPSADTPLTAENLIVAARALGVTISAGAPAAAVTQSQASAFVGAVRGSLRLDGPGTGAAGAPDDGNGTGSDKEGDINASCRGREARDGRKGTPASPADPNATAPPCDEEGEPTP